MKNKNSHEKNKDTKYAAILNGMGKATRNKNKTFFIEKC